MSWRFFRVTYRLGMIGAMTWGLVGVAWASIAAAIFPTVANSLPHGTLMQYYQAMPKELLAAMGLTDISLLFPNGEYSYAGYLGGEYFAFFPLLLGIYSVVYCGGLVSQEIERGTLDMHLSQPISRVGFLFSKFSGFGALVLTATILSYTGLTVASWIGGESINHLYLAGAHLVALLLSMAVAAYATLASCLLADPRRSLALAGGITALTYFANIIGSAVASLDWFQYLSLFHYYDALHLVAAGEVNWAGVGVYLGVFAASLAAAALVFRSKDLVK